MKNPRVLILDGCPGGRLAGRLQEALRDLRPEVGGAEKEGHCSVALGDQALDPRCVAARVRESNPDLVILCVVGGQWREAEAMWSAVCSGPRGSGGCPGRPVIIAGASMGPEEICALMERGATDFVLEPFSPVDLAARWLRIRRELGGDEPGKVPTVPGLDHLLGHDPGWRREVERIPLLAGCGASVLILGETGTGKELCARAIHQLGARRDRPFTPLNCGAIPTELVENELFGHTSGAYTSAVNASTGIVQAADGGTLFLDEVDALPLGAQVKLLRFLQTKEFRQVGGSRLLRADVRIVAATNIDLAEAVRAGKFRNDLYYRLNVLLLRLPPLRSRREDIPMLARHFVERFAEEHGKSMTGLSAGALQRLMLHDWPGNIRELENVIERAVITALEARVHEGDISLTGSRAEEEVPISFKAQKAKVVAAFERTYVQQLLAAHDGNISRAARAAQKNRRAFWELIRKHRLRVASSERLEAGAEVLNRPPGR